MSSNLTIKDIMSAQPMSAPTDIVYTSYIPLTVFNGSFFDKLMRERSLNANVDVENVSEMEEVSELF